MIKIDVRIDITKDDKTWFDDNKDEHLGLCQIFNNELPFLPENLDIIFNRMKYELKEFIRNKADKEFNITNIPEDWDNINTLPNDIFNNDDGEY